MQEVLNHLYAISQLSSSRHGQRQDSATHLARYQIIECRNAVSLLRLAFPITCHALISVVEPSTNKDMIGTLLSHVILPN